MPNVTGCITARKLRGGQCFTKRTGTQVYVRLSESALHYYGIDQHRIIGAAPINGNMCEVQPNTLVRPVPHSEILKNIADAHEWEENVGVKEPEYRPTFVTEAFVLQKKLTIHDDTRYIKIPMDRWRPGERVRVTVQAMEPKPKYKELGGGS